MSFPKGGRYRGVPLYIHIVLLSQHLATGPVRRVTGYELNPLRVDLEASVEQPQLHLEADSDHGLHFNYPASILLLGDQVRTANNHNVYMVP